MSRPNPCEPPRSLVAFDAARPSGMRPVLVQTRRWLRATSRRFPCNLAGRTMARQAYSTPLGYAPLPPDVVKFGEKALHSIQT